MGKEPADFSLRLKAVPPWSEILPPLALFLTLAILPYGEEFWRGWRTRKPVDPRRT